MADQQTSTSPVSTPQPRIIARSPEILNELPPKYRWEFTRRHPYYLLFWEAGLQHRQQPSDVSVERMLGEAAILVLRQIGVMNVIVPPGTNSEELELEGMTNAWQDGAIAPLTFRRIVGAMLTCLPPESRSAIGDFLIQSASTGDRKGPHNYQLFSDFLRLSDPALDCLIPGPIVSINLQAPLRTVVKAIENMVREQKAQHRITEHRRRDDKLPAYLEVWDRREGWCGDHYDVRKEQRLNEIADDLSESVSTIANRYRAAFRYLTGQDYRPEIWAQVVGQIKVSGLIGPDGHARVATRRRWISSERRVSRKWHEVPESVVSQQPSDAHGGTFLENMKVVQDMTSASALVMDIEELIGREYDNAQIAEALEVRLDDVSDLIDCLRDRHLDGI
jgi:hypothetical protein